MRLALRRGRRAQVWAILASPMLHGCDLRTVRQEHPDCFELITNPQIVKVNQDPAALPPRLVRNPHAFTTVANVLFGVGGALAVAGATWLTVELVSRRRARAATLALTPFPGGLSLSGTF